MSENPKDFDQLYPGRFLKAGDVSERPTFTIRAIELHDIEGEKGTKETGIVSFEEDKRGLVLNKTNGYCLRHMFGRDLTRWPGKHVTLFRDDNVQFGRERVSAIRIYGSPDIERDTEVEIKHPKKKAYKMNLRATGKPSANAEKKTLVESLRAELAVLLLANNEQMSEADASAAAARYVVRPKTFDADVQKIRDALAGEQAKRGDAS